MVIQTQPEVAAAPKASSERVRRTMRSNRSKGTGLELLARKELHRLGVKGYRLNVTRLPGKPDIVFPAKKIAVFLDGCFWHGCPTCKNPTPRTNEAFWTEKINRNKERDFRNRTILKSQGWTVLEFWEHEVKSNPSLFGKKVMEYLRGE